MAGVTARLPHDTLKPKPDHRFRTRGFCWIGNPASQAEAEIRWSRLVIETHGHLGAEQAQVAVAARGAAGVEVGVVDRGATQE